MVPNTAERALGVVGTKNALAKRALVKTDLKLARDVSAPLLSAVLVARGRGRTISGSFRTAASSSWTVNVSQPGSSPMTNTGHAAR